MKKYSFILLSLFLLNSCNLLENDYHDGKYFTSIVVFGMNFAVVNYELDGNTMTIHNSRTGTTKMTCKQFKDRIEYEENNGTTAVMYVLENGDLKLNEMITLRKVTSENEKEFEEISAKHTTEN